MFAFVTGKDIQITHTVDFFTHFANRDTNHLNREMLNAIYPIRAALRTKSDVKSFYRGAFYQNFEEDFSMYKNFDYIFKVVEKRLLTNRNEDRKSYLINVEHFNGRLITDQIEIEMKNGLRGDTSKTFEREKKDIDGVLTVFINPTATNVNHVVKSNFMGTFVPNSAGFFVDPTEGELQPTCSSYLNEQKRRKRHISEDCLNDGETEELAELITATKEMIEPKPQSEPVMRKNGHIS